MLKQCKLVQVCSFWQISLPGNPPKVLVGASPKPQVLIALLQKDHAPHRVMATRSANAFLSYNPFIIVDVFKIIRKKMNFSACFVLIFSIQRVI